ncbi:hypothetical protein C8J56DRAFT_909007 [Mycena floridula]|nr:hypothetical protein C8J56DRAFT_909007 [Mycena floridula]
MRLSTILSATVLLATLAYSIPISDEPTGSVKARAISLEARKDDSHTRPREDRRRARPPPAPAPVPAPAPRPAPPPLGRYQCYRCLRDQGNARGLVLHQMTCQA